MAHNDLDGILLASTRACVTSMQAHGPLTRDQRMKLEHIYNLLCNLASEVAGVGV